VCIGAADAGADTANADPNAIEAPSRMVTSFFKTFSLIPKIPSVWENVLFTKMFHHRDFRLPTLSHILA
jgi:hypothetical protein